MGVRDLLSDWEIDEVRHELESGDEPDHVAFRHGITRRELGSLMRSVDRRRWSEVEIAFVRDNYPNHGSDWPGWEIMGRSRSAIRNQARRLGLESSKRHKEAE